MLQHVHNASVFQTGTRRLKIGWDGAHWIVDVEGCEDLFAGLKTILRGWNITEQPVTGMAEPAMVFRKSGDTYDWTLPASGMTAKNLFGKPESIASAVSDFHYLFNGWFTDRFREYFTLHCAAVWLGDGVVLFPGGHRVGKSLLTVALAAHGHMVFADDVVAIEPAGGNAMALGMLPRIRLPLPPQAIGVQLRDFLDRHAILDDVEQQYLDLSEDRMAEVGRTSPITAIVQLKRSNKTGPASMDEQTNGAAMRALIAQNYSTAMPASSVFDHLSEIVSGASCHCMTYHKVEDAVSVLEAAFARRSDRQTGVGQ